MATTQPMSELELIRQQMNKRTDESLVSTHRMVGMVEESRQMGAGALEQLYHQGQQLDRINENMDTIHEDLKEAERELDNLEKCCGLFVLPWKKVKRPGKEKHFKSKQYNQPQNGASKAWSGSEGRGDPNVAIRYQATNQPGYIQRITNDAREDEMDQNLGHVANVVGELRSMAVDMNNEITVHNRKLDDIYNKADDNQSRMTVAQNQAERIVGKPKPKKDEPLIPTPGVGMVTKHMAAQAFK
uniref:Synaptosomal-associated protein 25 n=2 Tax=Schistocephalus solidus TaxID=70667 RepID=A0A0X3PLR3_SCHSO